MDTSMLAFVKTFIESRDPIATGLETRFPFRRLFGHCVRCARWARRLAVAEGAEVEVAEVSALFHDVGKAVDASDEGHAEAGAKEGSTYVSAYERIAASATKLQACWVEAFHTATAREIARGRLDVLNTFMKDLAYELGRAESPDGAG